MANNPYAEFEGVALAQTPTAPSAPLVDNPYAEFGGRSLASQQDASSDNPYSEFSGQISGRADSPQQDQRPGWEFANKVGDIWNSDENVAGKVWDTLNTPLVDLKRQGAKGVEAGAEEFASGLTSPLSAGLSIVTAGAGGLLENLGIDVAKMAGPELVGAAKTAGKLASAGFTALQLKGIADQSPEFVQAIRNGDTQKALELGTSMVLQGGTAALGAKHTLSDMVGTEEGAKATPGDQLVGNYQAALKRDTTEAQELNREFRKAVPNQGQRNAVHFFMEAGGSNPEIAPDEVTSTLGKWQSQIENAKDLKPALQRQVVDALKRAQNVSPDEVAAAQKLREMYDYDLERGAARGVLSTEGRKNYVARARWDQEPVEQERVSDAKAVLGMGEGPMDHTQQRMFNTTVDGILNGRSPVNSNGRYILDAGDLAADYHRAIGRTLARKDFVDAALGAAATDGRPLAVPSGSYDLINKSEIGIDGERFPTGEQALLLNSTTVPDHPLNAAEYAVLRKSGKLADMIRSGTLMDRGPRPDLVPEQDLDDAFARYLEGHVGEGGSTPLSKDEFAQEFADDSYYRGRYRFNTSRYDNNIRNRYAWTNEYGGDGNTYLRAPVAFHPEIAKQAKLILSQERSPLQSNSITGKILDLSTKAKQSLLSLSGFHWVQEGLRAVQSGVNPVRPLLDMLKRTGGWDMADPEHLKLVQAGGIQPGMQEGANSYAEGLRGHGPISKIPGVGPVIDTVNNALFGPNGYIDRLKLNAALHFAERLEKTNPNLDEMTRYKVAGQLANQRFGGLNYLQMGRSQTAQDILRLTLLAPDWMESNLRDFASTMGSFGKLTGFDLGRIALYNFTVAQTLNLLNTGKMHLDTPFGVQSQDGKKVYSVRTMPQDIFHALTAPRDFALNRLNPVISRSALEALTGRDNEGHLRDLGDQLKDLLTNATPMPLQGIVNAVTGNVHPGESFGDYPRLAAGVTSRANNSPAETLAYRLASENSSSDSLPSDQVEHFRKIASYEDRLRDGDQSVAEELQKQMAAGEISSSDFRNIIDGAKRSRLQSVVNRLNMSNAIDVWNLATNDEREGIAPIIAKKMFSFRRSEAQKLTPSERARMDVKLAKVFYDMATPSSAADARQKSSTETPTSP